MSLREILLVRRLRERDEKAFKELIATHGDQIYNLLYRMIGNQEEAKDLATVPYLQGSQVAVVGKDVSGAKDTLDASFKFRYGVLSKG